MRSARRLVDDHDYERHVRACVRRGERPQRPDSREQWRILLRHFPSMSELWEAPADPEPLSEDWQERFLATLVHDADFRAAVLAALRGGAR